MFLKDTYHGKNHAWINSYAPKQIHISLPYGSTDRVRRIKEGNISLRAAPSQQHEFCYNQSRVNSEHRIELGWESDVIPDVSQSYHVDNTQNPVQGDGPCLPSTYEETITSLAPTEEDPQATAQTVHTADPPRLAELRKF